MHIPNTKTTAKIGSKEVNIKVHEQEIIHLTVILWIVADCAKFLRMLVFKGQPDDKVKRRLHTNFLVKNKKV